MDATSRNGTGRRNAGPKHRRQSHAFTLAALAGAAAATLVVRASPGAWASDASHPWAYSGKAGPKVWGKLSPAFRTCETGADQSPIDLRNPSPGEGDTLRFDYAPSPLTLAHDGHTIRMDYAAGSALENGRGRYELTQLHFHAPSEHTVDGKAFPMELHLVHKDPEGHLAVVGVLFQLGQRNSAVAAVFDNMPARPGKVRVPGLLLDATALLPRKGGYFSYPGSLTTPPCDEGVRWHVLKARMTISKEQLASFRKVFGSNARPVQPLRDRVLREM